MEKPTLIFEKHADEKQNKIVIPKPLIKKWGYNFYMEVYKDKIVLKPIKKEK